MKMQLLLSLQLQKHDRLPVEWDKYLKVGSESIKKKQNSNAKSLCISFQQLYGVQQLFLDCKNHSLWTKRLRNWCPGGYLSVQETRVNRCHKLVFAKCNAQVLPQSKTSVFPHTRLSSHCSALSATFSFSKEQYQVRCQSCQNHIYCICGTIVCNRCKERDMGVHCFVFLITDRLVRSVTGLICCLNKKTDVCLLCLICQLGRTSCVQRDGHLFSLLNCLFVCFNYVCKKKKRHKCVDFRHALYRI